MSNTQLLIKISEISTIKNILKFKLNYHTHIIFKSVTKTNN